MKKSKFTASDILEQPFNDDSDSFGSDSKNYSFSIQILFLLQKDYMAQPLQTVLSATDEQLISSTLTQKFCCFFPFFHELPQHVQH